MNRRIYRAAVAGALVLVAGTACGQEGAAFCAANEAAAEVSVGLSTAIANGEEDEYYPKLADAYEAMAAVAPPEALERGAEALGVVEVADHALGALDRAAVAAGQRPHRLLPVDQRPHDLASDVSGGTAHQDHASQRRG